MNKYEAMFIIKPDLTEEARKGLFAQLSDVIAKSGGNVTLANIWSEKRKMCFAIKKYREGVYYLINFSAAPGEIDKIRHSYSLNENVLRTLITRPD